MIEGQCAGPTAVPDWSRLQPSDDIRRSGMRMVLLTMVMVLTAVNAPHGAAAAEIKVLTAGAFKQVLLALLPDFEKQTGHHVRVDNDTVGALAKRIDAGENFDLAILTPAAIN